MIQLKGSRGHRAAQSTEHLRAARKQQRVTESSYETAEAAGQGVGGLLRLLILLQISSNLALILN